jgi:hypothetical protein
MDRRDFLRSAGILGAAAAAPRWLAAAAEAPIAPGAPAKPVRVAGVVRAGNRRLAGVAVSDGLTTVETKADGTFTLLSSSDRPRVWVSVPSGYHIPVSASGTARFFAPLAPDRRGEATIRFDLEPLVVGDRRHAVLVLGDVQTQNRDETGWFHEQTVPDLLETRRALGDVETTGLAVGDIMFNDLTHYPEYERAVQRVGVPFFQVVGNHDLDMDEEVDDTGARSSGTSAPALLVRPRRCTTSCSTTSSGTAAATSATSTPDSSRGWPGPGADRAAGPWWSRCTSPLGSTRPRKKQPDIAEAVMNRELLYRLLEPFRVHILAGHMHESEHLFDGNRHEHVVGAVCGSWWSGPICADGTPRGYAVYEVDGEDVRWHYKSTGHGADHQIRLYPRGADPAMPGAVVANVWDWDPAWKVVWSEDGARRGEALRRLGHDPLSVELHTGPDKPARRGWVEPYLTNHLFVVPASAGAREVTVEATDRCGRVYTARLP